MEIISFFADETEVLRKFSDQIVDWFDQGKLKCPRVVNMPITEIVQGHELIQSGKSVDKIVTNTKYLEVNKKSGQYPDGLITALTNQEPHVFILDLMRQP